MSSDQHIQTAHDGSGPLLQRDYWAVLREARTSARGVARVLREEFPAFGPPDLVRFERAGRKGAPLEPGDELEVNIRLAGSFRVRVVHADEQSLTLATAEGHPEAGRITFGAYPNADGDVVVHIRSRARSSSSYRLLGFLTAGEAMQTTTWSGFIDRLAAVVAEGVRDVIHVETRKVAEEEDDRSDEPGPTFRAVGDGVEGG